MNAQRPHRPESAYKTQRRSQDDAQANLPTRLVESLIMGGSGTAKEGQ